MKEKIRAALVLAYKSMGYSDAVIDAVVAQLESTVTEDAQIEAAVKGVEPMMKAFQGFGDKRVTDAVDKTKKEAAQPEGVKSEGGADRPAPKSDEGKDPVLAAIERLTEGFNTVLGRVEKIESGGVAKSRREQFEAKLKDVPDAIRNSMLDDFEVMTFPTDEAFTAYLGKKETALKDIVQQHTNNGLAQGHRPIAAAPASGKQVEDAITAWAGTGKSAEAAKV